MLGTEGSLTGAVGLHSHLVQEYPLLEQVDLVVGVGLQVPLRVGALVVADILWWEVSTHLLICRGERAAGVSGSAAAPWLHTTPSPSPGPLLCSPPKALNQIWNPKLHRPSLGTQDTTL